VNNDIWRTNPSDRKAHSGQTSKILPTFSSYENVFSVDKGLLEVVGGGHALGALPAVEEVAHEVRVQEQRAGRARTPRTNNLPEYFMGLELVRNLLPVPLVRPLKLEGG